MNHHAVERRVRETAEPRLAIAQCLIRTLSLSDVGDHREQTFPSGYGDALTTGQAMDHPSVLREKIDDESCRPTALFNFPYDLVPLLGFNPPDFTRVASEHLFA